jgi:uncharacterized caspase-like protein
MKTALHGLQGALSPGCTVVVYYSGHGVQHAGTNYLVPVDGDVGTSDGMPQLHVPLECIRASPSSI